MPSVPAVEILAQTNGTDALPFVNEFLQHPDFTQIAAFLSGWVFISSVLSIARSPTIKAAVQLLTGYLSAHFFASYTLSVAGGDNLRKCDLHRDDDHQHDHFLVLLLFTCFALSSIAFFTSLLTYNAGVSSFVCAFVLASGGIFAGCGRVFGMVTLVLALWRLGAHIRELLVMAGCILSAVALMITEHTTSVGTSGFLPQLGTYLCYKIRYLPISLASSSVNLAIEAYILMRLLWLIPRNLLGFPQRMVALRDTRFLRAFSLIVLELLIMIPTITFLGRIGESVPFAIGSLLVLATFNQPVDWQSSCLGTPSLTPSSLRLPERFGTLPHVLHPIHSISPVLVGPASATSKQNLIYLQKSLNAEKAKTDRDSSWREPPSQRVENLLSISPAIKSTPPPRLTAPIGGDPGVSSDNAVRGNDRRKNRILNSPEILAEVEKAARRGLPIPPPLKIRIPVVVSPPNDPLKRHSSISPLGGSDIIRRGTLNNLDRQWTSVHVATRSPTTFRQSWTSMARSASNPPLSSRHSHRWLMFGGSGTSPTRRMTFSDLSVSSPGDDTIFGGQVYPTYEDVGARMKPVPMPVAMDKTDRAMETLQRNFQINLVQHRRHAELLRTRIRGPRPLVRTVVPEN